MTQERFLELVQKAIARRVLAGDAGVQVLYSVKEAPPPRARRFGRLFA